MRCRFRCHSAFVDNSSNSKILKKHAKHAGTPLLADQFAANVLAPSPLVSSRAEELADTLRSRAIKTATGKHNKIELVTKAFEYAAN